jgi:hypothetical protein
MATQVVSQRTEMPTTIDDVDAISRVVQVFIEAEAQGDAAKFAEAFHQDARMFGHVEGERYDMPITEYSTFAASQPANSEGTYRGRLVSVQQIGDAAQAVVAEDGAWGSVSFVDFLSLARIDDAWQIVSKTFAHTGGKMPQ